MYRASRLEEINGFTIAVEATWYLQHLLDVFEEPLLPALGGLPYSLKGEIEADLDNWKKHGITPLFVFDGLYIIGQEDMDLRQAKEATRNSDSAWNAYSNAKTPDESSNAVTAFGNLGTSSWVALVYSVLTSNRSDSAKDVLSFLPKDSS